MRESEGRRTSLPEEQPAHACHWVLAQQAVGLDWHVLLDQQLGVYALLQVLRSTSSVERLIGSYAARAIFHCLYSPYCQQLGHLSREYLIHYSALEAGAQTLNWMLTIWR